MSLFSKLFGGGASAKPKPKAEPVLHNGYRIFAEPAKEAQGYRLAARIEKEIDGEVKTHLMIRADTYGAQETAVTAAVDKARMLIDQQGERIFK